MTSSPDDFTAVDPLADPTFFADNRLPAHSSHRWYATWSESELGVSSFEQCLNGVWKFHYAKNAEFSSDDFARADYDCSAWDDIPVPGHIQLQGYDRPQYVNVQYPWDGHEQIEPGQIPTRFNPVALYVTSFTHDQPLAQGERMTVMFHGAESAIEVWLNGQYLGHATDSFTPSEFDLTSALVVGENKLAARVTKWTAGSWIEDQDMYRFSGIFRDVTLLRRPASHVDDVRVVCALSSDNTVARVAVTVRLSAGVVKAQFVDGAELEVVSTAPNDEADGVGSTVTLTTELVNPRLWSSEDPSLYELRLTVSAPDGLVSECVPLKVGVRRFGIEDGLLKINGSRVVFKGVNRHDFGLNGRVISREQTKADVLAMKAAGINAVRTCHYPDNEYFYDFCDEYGLYVIDEMNLESHGWWDRMMRQDLPVEEAFPGDRAEWAAILLDRAASLYQRDKNHASVVMWSCGNESFSGKDILAVSQYFRDQEKRDPWAQTSTDQTGTAIDCPGWARPVHYEGVYRDWRYQETSDVVSEMYTPADQVEEFLATHRDKPFILCEYAHAMGNSFGAVDRYMDLTEREPLFQGGFIWDFADQAIALKDRFGVPYLGYGGDCGDAPSDYEFCGNGIFFADHSPSPKVAEVRHVYQNFAIQIDPEALTFTVTNRHLFTDVDAFDCVALVLRDGSLIDRRVVPLRIGPGQTVTTQLPWAQPTIAGEYAFQIRFETRTQTEWAPAGHEVGWAQAVTSVRGSASMPTGGLIASPGSPRRGPVKPELIRGVHNVGVRGRHFSVLFAHDHGLSSYRYGLTRDGGRELLRALPSINFWHAPTSNEKGWKMGFQDGDWLLASRYAKLDIPKAGPAVSETDGRVEVTYDYVLPTRPISRATVTYRVDGDGRVEVDMSVEPGSGLPDMPEFGLMMVADADLSHLRWYGEGPQECYSDRRGGARLGLHAAKVADQLTPYLRPQEAGSHTGVRWATVTDDHGAGLRFECDTRDGRPDPMEFSALPWTPFEIENAAHHTQLPPIHHTVLRPALARRGVGGDNSWGAMTHPQYCLPTDQTLRFRFAFQGLL
ncbi:MAG: DUF4981 domain-containing protein [Propionibacteriaceae bacterium]|jgi:beta-galactosidase|nr:DUF4981 domain-containing protein [Propionibacteriaceae bacterium]